MAHDRHREGPNFAAREWIERVFPSASSDTLLASSSKAGDGEGLPVQPGGDVPAGVPEDEMDPKGQLSLIEVHPRLVGGRRTITDAAAASAASWSKVMEGFAAALTVPGLDEEDRQLLVDGYRSAARASGRPPLLLAPSPAEGRAAV